MPLPGGLANAVACGLGCLNLNRSPPTSRHVVFSFISIARLPTRGDEMAEQVHNRVSA